MRLTTVKLLPSTPDADGAALDEADDAAAGDAIGDADRPADEAAAGAAEGAALGGLNEEKNNATMLPARSLKESVAFQLLPNDAVHTPARKMTGFLVGGDSFKAVRASENMPRRQAIAVWARRRSPMSHVCFRSARAKQTRILHAQSATYRPTCLRASLGLSSDMFNSFLLPSAAAMLSSRSRGFMRPDAGESALMVCTLSGVGGHDSVSPLSSTVVDSRVSPSRSAIAMPEVPGRGSSSVSNKSPDVLAPFNAASLTKTINLCRAESLCGFATEQSVQRADATAAAKARSGESTSLSMDCITSLRLLPVGFTKPWKLFATVSSVVLSVSFEPRRHSNSSRASMPNMYSICCCASS